VREEGEKGGAGPRGTNGPVAEVGPVACTCAFENKENGREAGRCELLGRRLGGPQAGWAARAGAGPKEEVCRRGREK
jgi:hypothetical protein